MKLMYKLIFISVFLLSSCSGDSDSPDTTPEPVKTPKAVNLVFPDNNTECNEGVVVDDTKSTVTFKWTAAENAKNYEVNIRNLNTNAITKTNAVTNEAPITIERGTPYEWFVISKASTDTKKGSISARFKFYNQGLGVKNYAPFPAEAVSPEQGTSVTATTKTDLEWSASDVDDDIAGYEVFLGTSKTTMASVGKTTDKTTLEATVASGSTFYWKVVTTDQQENSSESEIFQFKVL